MAAAMRRASRRRGRGRGLGLRPRHRRREVRRGRGKGAARRLRGAPPPVSSVKGALGHSLGAATAVEAVVAVLALREGVLPPNANLLEPDAALDLDVVAGLARPDLVLPGMSCGYGFGGLNSAMLIERAVTAYCASAARWTSPSAAAAGEAVATWAAERSPRGRGTDALYLATLDAGARESVHFWRRAAAASRSPTRAFPWTLSNSPTGRIANGWAFGGRRSRSSAAPTRSSPRSSTRSQTSKRAESTAPSWSRSTESRTSAPGSRRCCFPREANGVESGFDGSTAPTRRAPDRTADGVRDARRGPRAARARGRPSQWGATATRGSRSRRFGVRGRRARRVGRR